MSNDQHIAIPVIRSDDCSAEQPPKDDAAAAACLIQLIKKEASPPSPAEEDARPAPPPMDDIAPPACLSSLPLDETVALMPKVEPEFSNANGLENADRVQVKQEIKHENIDLGNDTYFYDEDDEAVGFDRGLEPDHIVGATKVDGKLMFLIAWKNATIADLLESTEVYNRCPQLAIQFFEPLLQFYPNEENN